MLAAKRRALATTSTLAILISALPGSQSAYAQAAPQAAQAPAAAPVSAEWWRGFEDPVLDDLIGRATAGNPSLRVAAARTARASANVAAANAARAPLVTGQLDAMRQRFSENSLYPPPLAGSVQNTATAQLNGSWELDFFGHNRAQLDAAIGSERAASADADAARILLAVNVARSYVQLARLLEQHSVLERVLAQRDEVFSLTKQRVTAGLDTNVELRQSEGFLPETRQQLPPQSRPDVQRNAPPPQARPAEPPPQRESRPAPPPQRESRPAPPPQRESRPAEPPPQHESRPAPPPQRENHPAPPPQRENHPAPPPKDKDKEPPKGR